MDAKSRKWPPKALKIGQKNLQKTAKSCIFATGFPPAGGTYSEKSPLALAPGPVTPKKPPKTAQKYPPKRAPKSYPQSPAFVSSGREMGPGARPNRFFALTKPTCGPIMFQADCVSGRY